MNSFEAAHGAAIQALQMDISHLVPFRTGKRRGTNSPTITDSFPVQRMKDKKQPKPPKRKEDEQGVVFWFLLFFSAGPGTSP